MTTMTTMGHTLVGISIAVLFAPKMEKASHRIGYYLLFVFFALIPDIEVHGWGHNRYRVSHSIPVMLAMVSVLTNGVLVVLMIRCQWQGILIYVGCIVAWLSHFCLDSFYNHGYGVMVMWPLSGGRLNFALPWFSNTPPFTITMAHMRIYGIELVFYGMVFVLVIVGKRVWGSRCNAKLLTNNN